MKNTIKYALINALGTALYVITIVALTSSLNNLFPEEGETIFIPITMLMLFVFSTAFTGFLVFGRPVMWYLEGKKKEALALLFSTLAILLMIIFIVFIIMISILA